MNLKLDASYLKPKSVKICPTGEGLNAEQWTSEILQSNMNALFFCTQYKHTCIRYTHPSTHPPTHPHKHANTSTNTECYTTNSVMKPNEAKSKSYSVHRVAQIILERTMSSFYNLTNYIITNSYKHHLAPSLHPKSCPLTCSSPVN